MLQQWNYFGQNVHFVALCSNNINWIPSGLPCFQSIEKLIQKYFLFKLPMNSAPIHNIHCYERHRLYHLWVWRIKIGLTHACITICTIVVALWLMQQWNNNKKKYSIKWYFFQITPRSTDSPCVRKCGGILKLSNNGR